MRGNSLLKLLLATAICAACGEQQPATGSTATVSALPLVEGGGTADCDPMPLSEFMQLPSHDQRAQLVIAAVGAAGPAVDGDLHGRSAVLTPIPLSHVSVIAGHLIVPTVAYIPGGTTGTRAWHQAGPPGVTPGGEALLLLWKQGTGPPLVSTGFLLSAGVLSIAAGCVDPTGALPSPVASTKHSLPAFVDGKVTVTDPVDVVRVPLAVAAKLVTSPGG